jgi:hypothetical protein
VQFCPSLLWDVVYALKWGYTTRSFAIRGGDVICEITVDKGYPSSNLNPVLVAAIFGLPRDRKLLLQLEQA